MKQWINKICKAAAGNKQAPSVPAPPPIHSDDLFLVSYPKSGNTWMRFLLANLLRSVDTNASDEPIDFHSAVRYVPEYELHTDEVNAAERPRILKSHTTYNARFPRVAYLIRDPRDVYVSYYHYMRKRLPDDTDISSFMRMSDLHPCHWHTHVAGWVDQPNVLVIRYEDMLADTTAQVRRFLDFWGARRFSDTQIADAIQRSSFSNMKKLEQTNGRPFASDQQRKQSTPFMRSGKAGAWTSQISPDDHDYLVSRMGHYMERFDYDTQYPQTTQAQASTAA